MKYKVIKMPPDHDHDQVRWDNGGYGYIGRIGKKICIERCPKCLGENYGPGVATGHCCCCGYDPNEDNDK